MFLAGVRHVVSLRKTNSLIHILNNKFGGKVGCGGWHNACSCYFWNMCSSMQGLFSSILL